MAKDTITLETAQDWAAKWKENAVTYLSKNQLKAFLIPGIDVSQVLAEEGVVNVRSYLGIDENNEPHLMIIGVDADGNDMIDDSKGWFIYDFSEPCPNICNQKVPFISL
jgi:hypothetical protein